MSLTYTIHQQAKYQRLNANTLYVAAILFSNSTLHREALPYLPNKQNVEPEAHEALERWQLELLMGPKKSIVLYHAVDVAYLGLGGKQDGGLKTIIHV